MKIEEVNLTKDNLIKIKEIDDTFYSNDNLSIDWYLERYNVNHKALFLYDEKEVVGYILSVPITKELYDAITNGVIINDININPKMIVNKSDYNYIVSVVLLKEYRNLGYGGRLVKAFINLLENNKGNYCAITISKDGYIFANKFMNFKMNVYEDIDVFVKEYK